MPIIALASIIAHEMIHQYLIEVGDGCKRQYDKDKNGIPYDAHDNDEFRKWKDLANSKHGLYVTYEGSKQTYGNDAADALKKFAGSDYAMNEATSELTDQFMKRVEYGTGLVNITYF